MEKERRLSSRQVFEGRLIKVRVDEIEMKSGRTAVREVVEHHKAVGILALTDRDSVLLVRQYRYAAGEETLEVCAGLVEDGEDLEAAAAREMQEELGYRPGRLREIGRFYASPGFCTELLVLFLATELNTSSLPQDDDEDVSTLEVRCEDIPDMLARGAFRDSKTFAALSWFMAYKGLKPHIPSAGTP